MQQPQQYMYNSYAQGVPITKAPPMVNVQVMPPQMPQYTPMPNIVPMYQQNYFYQTNSNNQYPPNYNNNFTPAAPQPVQAQPAPAAPVAKEEKVEKKDEKKKKDPVVLTDDYLKSLENYLNNPNDKIRLMGAKELFERFKEDDTRKRDPALCALLNKALQDKLSAIKFLAMTSINTDHAIGDQKTVQILQQIQASKADQNDDALLASQTLLKLAGSSQS